MVEGEVVEGEVVEGEVVEGEVVEGEVVEGSLGRCGGEGATAHLQLTRNVSC